MPLGSKSIKKVDDESKQFIIDCLNGDLTHGFDLDSIYYFENTWHIFEYLKCESDHMTPHTSNPKYYPYNWRKFYNLYVLSRQLNGVLWLVNYSTRESDGDLVCLMKVVGFDYDKIRDYEDSDEKPPRLEYMTLETTKMTRDQFSQALRRMNRRATLPPEL